MKTKKTMTQRWTRLFAMVFWVASTATLAQSDPEREHLSLLLSQLETVIAIAKNAEAAGNGNVGNARYTFDYEQLNRDLSAIKEGVSKYLTPARAMPMVPPELEGDYTQDRHRSLQP